MSDRASTIAMVIFFSALAVGASVLTTWFLVTHGKRLRRAQDRSADIVARQDDTLKRLATLLGTQYTPGRMVSIPGGGTWPSAGMVRRACRNLEMRVTFFVDNDMPAEGRPESWYLPLAAVDLPQGARWVVEPTGRLAKKIYGNQVRKGAAAGRTSADFQRAFGVPEEALPPTTRALLWSVGERSHTIEFSSRGVAIALRPSDLIAHESLTQTIWEGGYDVDQLAGLLDQVCALVASLLVPAVSPGVFDAGR